MKRGNGRDRRVLFIQYANPGACPPIENAAHILAEKGWSVRLLGVRWPALDRLTFRHHPRIDLRILHWGAGHRLPRLRYVAYFAWSLAHVIWWRPAWIYASDVLAAPGGLVTTFLPRTRVVFHEHDAPSETSPIPRPLRAARSALLRRSPLIVIPDGDRARSFPPAVRASGRVAEVWNCPRRGDVPAPKQPSLPPIRIHYHGTLVPERLPLHVIDALAALTADWRLVVAGYETVVNPGYVGRLRERARSFGCEDRLEFHGVVARSDLLDLAATSHVGLALVPRRTDEVNLRRMVRASNKVFDYLASGVVPIVSNDPAWERAYVDAGVGLACDPHLPASLTAVLEWCAAHPGEVRAMGQRGRELITSAWNYDDQFAPVERVLAAPLER